MAGVLSGRTKGRNLALEEKSVPLPPPINRCDFHAPKVEKIWSKGSQKTSHFWFQPTFTSLPSLPTVSSAPEAPTHTFLLHQKTAVQPPYEPKSSPVAEQPRTAEPLSSATFLLPSPATDTGHHSLHQSLLSH